MTKDEPPEEVRRGMVRVSVLVGLPALVAATAGFFWTENPYVPVAVMIIASGAMAYEWYDRGYFSEDEWDEL